MAGSEQSAPWAPGRLFVQEHAEGHTLRETQPPGPMASGGRPPPCRDSCPFCFLPEPGGVLLPGAPVTVLDALRSECTSLGPAAPRSVGSEAVTSLRHLTVRGVDTALCPPSVFSGKGRPRPHDSLGP